MDVKSGSFDLPRLNRVSPTGECFADDYRTSFKFAFSRRILQFHTCGEASALQDGPRERNANFRASTLKAWQYHL
ncbi:MAG: hypothetical protein ACTHOP_08065 [Mesorhizobium sp.]|jgi:hypothetical protein